MHTREAGPRDAPAVLLIHGQIETGATYAGIVERLSRTRRVLVPDCPGYGSSPLADPYSFRGVEAELAGVLATRGVASTAVVGFSLGAYHAIALALAHPDVVKELVLLAPIAGLDAADRARFGGFRDALAAGSPFTAFDAILIDGWFPRSFAEARPDVVAAVLDAWHSASRDTLVAEFGAIADMADLRPRLGEIRARTLVRVGREDLAVPMRSAEAIAHAIPGARFEVVDGAGHLLLHQDRDATTSSVCAHLGAA